MLEIGSLLQGRYRIERLVGQGGMGTVYLATEEQLGKHVAVKAMTIKISDPEERERALRIFQNEARMLAALEHPGLVDVTHYFTEGDLQFLVMSYVDGITLEAKSKNESDFLPVATVLEWMDEVMGVLEYLHGRQPPVVVRDLKPANIMLDSNERIRLIDFGIARCLDAKETTTFSGTPGYASLEQFGGTTDPRADIYAAGASLYTLLTGMTPPASIDLILQTATLDPPSFRNPAVSNALNEVVLKLMALQKEDRYQTVREARQALRQVQAAESTTAPPRRVRFCPECGSPLAPADDGCAHCGARAVPLGGAPVAPSPQTGRASLVPGKGLARPAAPAAPAPERPLFRALTPAAPPAEPPPPVEVPPEQPAPPLHKASDTQPIDKRAVTPTDPPTRVVPGPLSDKPLELVPGATVDARFVLEQPLGESHWLGHLVNMLTQRVVLQVWSQRIDSAAIQALRDACRHEAERVVALDHPHLAEVIDAFVVGRQVLVASHFVAGVPLDQLLGRLGGVLPVPLALGLIAQLFDTVEFVHEQGLFLGDLRPSRILITSGGQCKLADLGVGGRVLEALTGVFFAPGPRSLGFAGPERYRPGARPNVAGDLYSLGAVAYQVFTRQTPPPALHLVSGQAMLASPELLNRELPPRMRVLISKLMHAEPDKRFASVAEARKCLEWVFEPTRKSDEHHEPEAPKVSVQDLLQGPAEDARPRVPSSGMEGVRPRLPSAGVERPPVPLKAKKSAAGEAGRPRVPSGGLEMGPGPRSPRPLERPAPPRPPRLPVSLDTGGGRRRPEPVESAEAPPPTPPKPPPVAPPPRWAAVPPPPPPPEPPPKVATAPRGPEREPDIDGLNIEASVALPGTTFFQRVRVVEFSLKDMTFASTHVYRVRTPLALRIHVSSQVLGKPLEFQAEVLVRKVTPDSPEVSLYNGLLRGIPADVRTRLEEASVVGRRRAPRMREFFQVTCVEPSFRALGTDISSTGIGIASPDDLPKGLVVELLLELNDDPAATSSSMAQIVTVKARVMHSVKGHGGRFEIGLEFAGMSADDTVKLRRYLRS